MDPTTSRPHLIQLASWSIPLLMIMVMALLSSLSPDESHAPPVFEEHVGQKQDGRLVLVIVDSLRRQTLDAHMPKLKQWAKGGVDLDIKTCSANYTVPCVQTLMEGRQSPFVAGLHNFTGKKGGQTSLPAQLKAAKRHQILISDFTLDTLYGPLAQTSLNAEKWPGNWLTHDRRAIKEAGELLKKTPDLSMMVLHIVGTDKIAHRKLPGHPQYAEHHKLVDDDLAGFLQQLGPKDHVLITGDHGHDEKGHHTRDSILLAQSPLIKPLFAKGPPKPMLKQHEITYLMWFALGLPVSPAYEGRYFGIEQPVDAPSIAAHLKTFQETQKRTLTQSNFKAETLTKQIQAKRDHMQQASINSLLRYSPMMIIYLWWLFWMISAPIERARTKGVVLAIVANAIALFAGMFAPPTVMGGLAGVLTILMTGHLWRTSSTSHKRLLSWLVVLLAMGGAIAYAGPKWSAFWHTKGGFQWTTPMFFLGLIGLGFVGSKWRSGSWKEYMPEALGSVCLIALPSGVYFYQFGSNILRGLFMGGLVLTIGFLLARLRHGRLREPRLLHWREISSLGLLLTTGVLLMHQTAGGWEWHFVLTRALKRAHPVIPIAIYGVMGLMSVTLMKPSLRGYMAHVLLWLLPVVYSGKLGQLPYGVLAGTSVAMAFAYAFGRTTYEGPILHKNNDLSHERYGWWWLAIAIYSLWIGLSGFFLGQVDFTFSFAYLSMFKTEATVAFFSTWLTMAKYTFPVWIWVFAMHWMRTPEAKYKQMHWFWAFLHLKCLALFVAIFLGPMGSEQKLYELSISELMFTMTAGWMVIGACLLLAAGRRIFYKPFGVSAEEFQAQQDNA